MDPGLVRLIFGVILLLIIGGVAAHYLIVPNVPPPSGLTHYVAPDRSFSVDIPQGWDVTWKQPDVQHNVDDYKLIVTNGPAKIDIEVGTLSEFSRNALLSGGNVTASDFVRDPSASLQEVTEFRGSYQVQNYHEDFMTARVKTKLGDAVYTDYKGKGGMFGIGGPVTGYRASICDGEKTYMLILQSPTKSWAGLEPTYLKVIKSMSTFDGGPDPALEEDNSNTAAPPPGAGIPGSQTDTGSGGANGG